MCNAISFYFASSIKIHYVEHIFIRLFAICVSSFSSVKNFCPFFNWVVSFLRVEFKKILCIFWIQVLNWTCALQRFFSKPVAFDSLNNFFFFFCKVEVLSLNEIQVIEFSLLGIMLLVLYPKTHGQI